MSEMAELYPPSPPTSPAEARNKTLQAWKTVLNWVAFFIRILLQILRGTPSWAQVVSYAGFGHRNLLFSSSTDASAAEVDISPSTAFKPLSSEVPEVETEMVESGSMITKTPFCASLDVCYGSGTLEKLTVVLDLDETLVSAYETSSLPATIRSQAIEAGLKCFELECTSIERGDDGKPRVNHVIVFERPGLHEFLQQLSEFADLVLFTAGLEGYASPLVDKIDIEKRFTLRLYRPATITTEYREHVKDLSCLSRSFCRTVIVDNNPFSFLLQPLNGIPCMPFYAAQPYPFDEQLLGTLLPLLRHLSRQNDVRPVLYERFHMPEWFEKQGIPMSNWALDLPSST